ncbi:valine--tRNA ligase [Candidatus Peribacteria bacterium RIFCSPHIGHO2_02_FULL_52_16]|nr:MAG: valine--tRNA ligase [Candidatus Peribacteria bacterium RIFCSPHIGHO2_01_FULL_51_35]OGJ61822.1 MAG: valine--tRNA ligase [Candidatus Peribacteria bacterium RIFCSPHIGHO2_02_FULL_52_16]
MLDKAYDPQAVEDRIYDLWEKSGAFVADNASEKEPFTIVMPPPNATGQLHLGHAVMLALQDIFIRFNRMRGKEVLWVPGTDHAAIATESVVIKEIQKKEKIPDVRAKLGREELIRRIADFVENSRGIIRGQVRKMGASCDWTRERYTMDPMLNRCVNEMFTNMYRDQLIYRGHRIVNWDPKLQTTVSDDEIEWKEETVPFYTFQYGPFQISTSRPETKFGDKYVVMHPDDARYKKYKQGDTFECEWINGKVKATIIKDKAVDPAFGTGVMTITPWHDAADFEIAERHDLEKQQIIGYDGKMLPIAGEFEGLKIDDARAKVIEKLQRKGLVVKVDDTYVHRVAISYRGKGVIEPQIKEQWFIDVNKRVVSWKRKKLSLKEILQEVIKQKQIEIIPERFEKTYFHWIDNLRDWCISRQIWWGHRIPVWYRNDQGSKDTHVGVQPPEGKGWEQDADTLDTWFSSALWTWSTLVDPALATDYSLSLQDILKKSPDFQKFHPTQVMETGYDILFFWVARMILMTSYATGDIPFEKVYLHGMIRTRDGKKMSKSDPETMIDPLDIIPKYGADALRLSMIVGQSPGNDSRLYEEKIAGYRNFVNKLWNASRFVLMQCEQSGVNPVDVKHSEIISLADKALAQETAILLEAVTGGIEKYLLSHVGEMLYAFTWDFFCDWYLEYSKGEPNPQLLVQTMRLLLIILHPYCPFVTEELWTHFKPKDAGMLIKEKWPKPMNKIFASEAAQMQSVNEAIQAIRKLSADQTIEPGKKLHVTLSSKKNAKLFESQREHIERMGKLEKLDITDKKVKPANAVSALLPDAEVYLSLEGLIDIAKEHERLTKEKEQAEAFLKGIEAKLNNKQFMDRAKPEIIAMEQEKRENAKQKIEKITERLSSLPQS